MPPDPPIRYRDVLAEPRFRTVFGARSLATAADTLRTVALSVLIFLATGSALLSAIAHGASFVPQLIGGSLLGALTDRAEPRGLIALGYGVESAVALLLATGITPVWLSLSLVAAIAFVTPVFTGLTGRVIADVLPGERYAVGRSMSLLASSVAQLVGLVGGGGAVALLGSGRALLVSAVLHALACLWVRTRLPVGRPARRERTGTVRAGWTTNRRLLRDRDLRVLIVAQWLPTAAAAGAEGLFIPYAAARWAAESASLLLAGLPAGMVVGTVLVGRLVPPGSRDRLVIPLLVLVGAPLTAFWFPLPFAVALFLSTLSGAGLAYGVCVQSRFRDLVPVRERGQAFTLLATGLMTAQGLSPAVFGLVADHTTAGAAVAVAGLLAVVHVVWRGPDLIRVLRTTT
ncbi:hypothetical protein UO65_0963 [Actinokineospora spheciospongiae]|uniref:MFS transporter n=1 Tax=Actinokineospora spheciospongiae TaxID=909613 RepID=W7J3U9_9PSEU|nr:MFS transporter [Actinokineospora spheciospongiae]EWC63666.1 hypothetical protein UO65_0963 [Actinokineospora spheciospongiae]